MRRTLIVLIASVWVLAACGARLTDEQWAALEAEEAASAREQGGVAVGIVDGSDRDATTTTVDTTRTRGGTTADGSQNPSGADQEAGGGQDGSRDANDSACGGGADVAPGVTADEIRIGNVSTISGPIPGFGQTGVNAVKAYVNYVNATGGVCGRTLSLITADDRLQSGTNKSETDKLKDQVLGFVGGVTVVDDGAAQSLQGTDIIWAGLSISDAMIRSENNFSMTPLDLDAGGNGAVEILRYMKEVEGVSRAGLVWPAQAAAKARIEGYMIDLERAGIPVVLESEVAVTETNYAGVAANVKEAKVDVLLTTLEITGMSNLARDLQTVGYFPKVPFYGAQAYGRDFLARAGEAAEPTMLGLAYSLLEDRGSIPMVDDFVTWYENTNPGADIDFFAIMSWAAADYFVTALRNIDGPPTREALWNSVRTLGSFDADGFLAPIDPAKNQGASCFVIAKVRDGRWYRDHPAQPGFECSYG